MEYDPKDNDVINLLKKLKDSNGSYPQEMYELRRERYLKQVAEVGAGIGLAGGFRNVLKSGKIAGLPPATGTIIEVLLVVAILAEAGAVTYFYRDKLAQYFQSTTDTPKVEQVSKPPAYISPSPELELTPSPVATGTETLTPATPSITPTDEILVQSTQEPSMNSNTGSGGSVSSTGATSAAGGQAASTEAPKGNNGNHYGQTPLPVRTKVPGNNSNSSSSSSTQESHPSPKQKKP